MEHDGFMGATYFRRFPLYLIIDCSDAMGGVISSISEGVTALYHNMMRDAQAVESVHISLIRFADAAEQDEFIPIREFVPPRLVANGACALGSALHVLVDSLENDLRTSNVYTKGDYRPLAFLLLAGSPSDDWAADLHRLQALRGALKPTIIALACSSSADLTVLDAIADQIIQLASTTPDALMKVFTWVSRSIAAVSTTVGEQAAAWERFSHPAALMSKVEHVAHTRDSEDP